MHNGSPGTPQALLDRKNQTRPYQAPQRRLEDSDSDSDSDSDKPLTSSSSSSTEDEKGPQAKRVGSHTMALVPWGVDPELSPILTTEMSTDRSIRTLLTFDFVCQAPTFAASFTDKRYKKIA